MIRVLDCAFHEHDLRIVAMSAVICVLGCLTTTTLLTKTAEPGLRHSWAWLISAAMVFGSSVWSLHFVAMLAFTPAQEMAYDTTLTVLSDVVAVVGSLLALHAWRAPIPRFAAAVLGGILFGLAISGMHYLGVAAMTFSGFLIFDRVYVAASLVMSIAFSILALARAFDLRTMRRRFEVAIWLTAAICGLHFTGMAAVTIAPLGGRPIPDTILGTTSLAAAIAGVSIAILIASLGAVTMDRHLWRRSMDDLARLRLLANLPQEVLFIHRDGIVLEINSAGERMFRENAEQIIGRPVLTLFTEDSTPAVSRREQCPPQERRPEEVEVQTSDGTVVPVELSCQSIAYLGKPATAVALRDLTDRKRNEAQLSHLARHDALTNLPNRYNLQERLDRALSAASQNRDSVAIIYIDLDRFKPVNDLHGHAAGDEVLVQASKRILAETHPADTLSRIGGDEFVMILTSQPQPENASIIAGRIIECLRRPFEVEGHAIDVGASVGISLYPEDGTSPDALMRAADAAMYRAKQERRGSVRFFEASMNAQHHARLQLEQQLTGAIQRRELLLHYQPIVNGTTGEVETFEALIRWQHPQRGMVPPMDFIPLAEVSGQIDQIGQWVINTACQDAAAWSKPWRVSVNVSPKQFRQTDICKAVATALATHQLNPSRFVVEVTESVLIDDATKAVATLNRLRVMGVRIALDDFGTGYSSLSYLQLFKFDKIKIDKSFVKKLGTSDDALTITRAIINLGHNLGLQVTAEGVETPQQLEILQALGCDQIQGYLIARAALIETFSDLDRQRTRILFGHQRPRLTA